MGVYHYDDTPLPVGIAVSLNGSSTSYGVGLYDGATYADQYASDPDEAVYFASRDGAKRWLEAVTEVLTPYIEDGDRAPRIPDPDGWTDEEE